MSLQGFDEETSKRLDQAYNAPEIVRRRGLARAALAAEPGDRVLDIGCGPGYYVTELVSEVGPNGSVVGLDSSGDMLAIARHRAAGVSNAEFVEGVATELPGHDDEFDRIISVQVLEYVEDTATALAEIFRALKPYGRVVVWDSDWESVAWYSRDPERMTAVVHAWHDHLVHRALPRTLASSLRAAGFVDVRLDAHAFASTDLAPDGFVGALFPLVDAFVSRHPSVAGEVAQAWKAEQRELSDCGEFYFALTQCCFTATKPG
ncbi:MAG: methyltransferase domain-containing protein [Acidimicrobiales bacterium]|nr:methyltransferase domain-containing protein [Acidimicrobiales bacterium]